MKDLSLHGNLPGCDLNPGLKKICIGLNINHQPPNSANTLYVNV
jgi:hypothetical protein